MMDFKYTVKVYADAVECDMRSLDTIPVDYRQEVERELKNRRWKAGGHSFLPHTVKETHNGL